MSTTPITFHAPAFQDLKDFANDPAGLAVFQSSWNTNVKAWTQQAMASATANQNQQCTHYDLSCEDLSKYKPPPGTLLVEWVAFPARLTQYLGQNQSPPTPYNYTQEQIYELADTGYLDGKSFPNIPTRQYLCPVADWSGDKQIYGPYGPRGWLDEYCEWSVVRNEAGTITRIDFVCENPEYWYSVWAVNPQLVARLYEEALNFEAPPGQQIKVAVEDLYLLDQNGKPVKDPSTGQFVYNPLNKWNRGTVSLRSGDASAFSGGAMHLTSTPNTVQTEMGLAGSATIQRKMPPPGAADTQALICCGLFGQAYRHSDPHIGQMVNLVVGGGARAAIADPTGLYIQWPQFDAFDFQLPDDPKLPAGAKPSDCWQVVRGAQTLTDSVTGQPYPGNFITHAVFQVPQAWRDAGVQFEVGDITINGLPLQWAGQLAQAIHIGLFARGIPGAQVAPVACANLNAPPSVSPAQMMYQDVWNVYYNNYVPNPMGQKISLASNTVMTPPTVAQGTSGLKLVLTCTLLAPNETKLPALAFLPPMDCAGEQAAFGQGKQPAPDNSLKATVKGVSNVTYAQPGNSYPSQYQLVTFELSVAAGAAPGLWGVLLTDPNQSQNNSGWFPALLLVVPAAKQPRRAPKA